MNNVQRLLFYLPEPILAGRLAWVPIDAHPLPDDPTFDPSEPAPRPRTLEEHPGAALIAQWRMPGLYSLQDLMLMNEYWAIKLNKTVGDMIASYAQMRRGF